MNGDAAEALARMKTKAAAQPTRTVEALQEEPVATLVPPPANPLGLERASGETTIPLEAAATPSDLEKFDGVQLNSNNDVGRADGLELQEEVDLTSAQTDAAPLEGLARTQYEGSGAFKVDVPARSAEPPPPLAPRTVPAPLPEPELLDEDMPTVDLPLIMPDDVSATAPRRGPPRRPTPPPEPARVSMPLPLLDLEPARAPPADAAAPAATGALSQPQPGPTGTMPG